MTAFAEIDPFAESADKSPAISFANAPVGTVITVVVAEPAKKVQGKEYGTENPAVWPDGNPKYNAVINGTNADTGEACSVWAKIPSDLFAKIQVAQKTLGRAMRAGDTLAIKFTGEEPGKGNPKKIYAVKITGGTPPAAPADDPFSSNDAAPF